MAIDFPNSPVTNDTYVVGDRKWVYDGEKWALVSASPELLVVSPTAPTNTNVIWADTTVAGTINSFIPSGAMMPFAGATSPTGWLLCYGQTLVRASYPDLFAVVGTTYNTGGEAGTDFRLPDLRGRTVAGQDNMGGTAASRLTSTVLTASDTLGATGGTQTHTLTSAQSGVPAHAHAFAIGNVSNFTGIVGSTGHGGSIRDTGTTDNNTAANASQAHPITQPTIVLTYIIKT
jgi:microcystin-dependent protein